MGSQWVQHSRGERRRIFRRWEKAANGVLYHAQCQHFTMYKVNQWMCSWTRLLALPRNRRFWSHMKLVGIKGKKLFFSVYTCVHTCAHVCIEARDHFQIVFQESSTWCLGQVFWLASKLPIRLGWLANKPRDLSVSAFRVLGLQPQLLAWLFIFLNTCIPGIKLGFLCFFVASTLLTGNLLSIRKLYLDGHGKKKHQMWKEEIISLNEQDQCHRDLRMAGNWKEKNNGLCLDPETSWIGGFCFGRKYLKALFSKSAWTNLMKS